MMVGETEAYLIATPYTHIPCSLLFSVLCFGIHLENARRAVMLRAIAVLSTGVEWSINT